MVSGANLVVDPEAGFHHARAALEFFRLLDAKAALARQHAFAIDDFSTALGLANQNVDAYVARALSYLAIGDNKSAAQDLDGAVQSDPLNLRAWTSRGLAYERLGQKDKAAGSYAKALNINDKYQPAKDGFARVGGRIGQTYPTF